MARITTRITNVIINATAHAVCYVADKANFNAEQNLALTKRLHKLDKIVLKALERDEERARKAFLKARETFHESVENTLGFYQDVARDAAGIRLEEATQAKEKAIEKARAADQAFRDQIEANVASFDAKHAALMYAKKAEAVARQACKDCGGTFGDGEAS